MASLSTIIGNHIQELGTTATYRAPSTSETFDGEEVTTYGASSTINCVLSATNEAKITELFGEYEGEELLLQTTTPIVSLGHVIHDEETFDILKVLQRPHKTEGIVSYKATLKKVVGDG